MAKTSAAISVINMQPVQLAVSADKNGWACIPTALAENGATIFTPTASTNGAADIEVKEDGYLFLACNWDYQGNSSGDWEKDRWTEGKFKSKGWSRLSKNELGGELVKNDNRAQTVFFKRVKKARSCACDATNTTRPTPSCSWASREPAETEH